MRLSLWRVFIKIRPKKMDIVLPVRNAEYETRKRVKYKRGDGDKPIRKNTD
jgi:hypothetical protein